MLSMRGEFGESRNSVDNSPSALRISVRRAWSDEEIAKLRSMAKRYPARVIAAELGRGVSATMVKAHELRLSLKVQSKKIIEPTVDPGPAGFDWPKRLEPVTRNVTVKK